MSVPERVTPLVAAISAVSTLACCLPIGLAATAGAAGVLAALSRYRSWFLALSAALLTIGVAQAVRAQRACRPGRRASLVILIMSTAVVAAVLMFPQVIAGLLADWLP
jgi:cytochrome bd-type quinol oxidase subunit 2